MPDSNIQSILSSIIYTYIRPWHTVVRWQFAICVSWRTVCFILFYNSGWEGYSFCIIISTLTLHCHFNYAWNWPLYIHCCVTSFVGCLKIYIVQMHMTFFVDFALAEALLCVHLTIEKCQSLDVIVIVFLGLNTAF